MREAMQILDVAVSSYFGFKLDVQHMLHATCVAHVIAHIL